MKEHIRSFPKYKSHYSRASNPHRQYLSPDLSITKMHVLYVDVCSTQGKHAVSEWVYRKIFNETFNLSFGRYVYDPLSPSLSPSLPPLPPSLLPSLPFLSIVHIILLSFSLIPCSAPKPTHVRHVTHSRCRSMGRKMK